LLDWQAVRRGHPGRELAYTLITVAALRRGFKLHVRFVV
jgi:hypothetical protein